MTTEFHVEDLVRRPAFRDVPERCGVVKEVYKSRPSHTGASDTLYAVQWSDNTEVIERGYLAVGLEKVL